MDCIDADGEKARRKIYDKITRMAEHLVSQGERIETRVWHSNRQQARLGDAHFSIAGGQQ